MTQVIPETQPHKPTDIVSIDTIKKAFIQQHQLPAANQPHNNSVASADRVEAIKRAIAPLECAFNTSVKVVAQALVDCPRQGSVQIHEGKAILIANGIHNDQQAHDQFYLAVVGLLAVPHYLDKRSDKTIQRIYESLSQDQKNLIVNLHQIEGEHKVSEMVSHYLAQLASMSLTPSFHDRRNSFQRNLLRLCYPKIKWNNLDLHYLILQAKKSWIRKNK